MKYCMVVSDKGHNQKSPFNLVAPFRSYAIERYRSGEDVERRARAVRNAGGRVLAVGLEDDRHFEQKARLAVVQLTNGSWSADRARQYLLEYLLNQCQDPEVRRINRLLLEQPA